MRRDSPQPVNQVGRRLNLRKLLVKLEKYLLGQVFRQRTVMDKMVCNAEDHALMLFHELSKGRVISGERLFQGLRYPVFLLLGQISSLLSNTHSRGWRMQFFSATLLRPRPQPNAGHDTTAWLGRLRLER